jgi:hypothetical protein
MPPWGRLVGCYTYTSAWTLVFFKQSWENSRIIFYLHKCL